MRQNIKAKERKCFWAQKWESYRVFNVPSRPDEWSRSFCIEGISEEAALENYFCHDPATNHLRLIKYIGNNLYEISYKHIKTKYLFKVLSYWPFC